MQHGCYTQKGAIFWLLLVNVSEHEVDGELVAELTVADKLLTATVALALPL
jgi:hypothetical protein